MSFGPQSPLSLSVTVETPYVPVVEAEKPVSAEVAGADLASAEDLD